jgi:hypothetical protein
MLVYTNADMLFTDELRRSLLHVLGERREKQAFVVGKRYDSNRFASQLIDFDDGERQWQQRVRSAAARIPVDFKHNENRFCFCVVSGGGGGGGGGGVLAKEKERLRVLTFEYAQTTRFGALSSCVDGRLTTLLGRPACSSTRRGQRVSALYC